MVDFDAILGMDFLTPNNDIINCNAKIVALVMPCVPRVEWKGGSGSYTSKVISFLYFQRLVDEGVCLT